MGEESRVSRARSARRGNLRAKVGVLRGKEGGFAGVEGSVLMLNGMRALIAARVGHSRLVLVKRDGGFALRFEAAYCPHVWLIAERSQRLRIFKSVETAVGVCRELGVPEVHVLLGAPEGHMAPPRLVQ